MKVYNKFGKLFSCHPNVAKELIKDGGRPYDVPEAEIVIETKKIERKIEPSEELLQARKEYFKKYGKELTNKKNDLEWIKSQL